MNAASGQGVAGICRARGENADVPPVWMVYIVLADLDDAMRRSESHGGKILRAPKGAGGESRFCVIPDPAVAIAALYESRPPQA